MSLLLTNMNLTKYLIIFASYLHYHSYWSKGNEDRNYKFINDGKIKRQEILIVICLIAVVVKNGMDILGVSLPEKM